MTKGSPSGAEPEWQWRRRIRANAHTRRLYRAAVALLGLVIVVAGLALVPLPGPGWLVVLFGIVVWASEFAWAARLRDWVTHRLSVWNEWLARRSGRLKAWLGLGAAVSVGAACYAVLVVSGVPEAVPDSVQSWLARLPGV